ncbi:MAG: hypothetical protein V3T14_05860 [Myxococcota bacterium]
MGRFFNRGSGPRGITGVALSHDGFAITHVVRRGNDRPVLKVCKYHPCSEPDAMRRALTLAVKVEGLEGSRCVCIPQPGVYSLRQIDAPPVAGGEIREAARWQIMDLVDFDIETAAIDVFEIPTGEHEGQARRMFVAAAPQSLIDQAVELVKRAGLEVLAIDIYELALRNLATLLPQNKDGVAVLYLSPDLGLLTITKDRTLYMARNLDADVEKLGMLPNHEGGAGGEVEEAQQILDALLLEAQRSLDYFEAQLRQPPVTSLLVAPTESPLPAVVSYLDENLAVNVATLDVNPLVECELNLPPSLQALCLPALGAALRAET